MFGRKKYRKGKTYLYFMSGLKKYSDGNFKDFFSSGKIKLNINMDACEMRDEVIMHTRKAQELPEEYDESYTFRFYHVEKN